MSISLPRYACSFTTKRLCIRSTSGIASQGLRPQRNTRKAHISTSSNLAANVSKADPRDDPRLEAGNALDFQTEVRLPRSVQAVYLKPLKRKAEHGLPVCDLQLRSYNVRNVEFFADFALRAAYYLNLPASGPVPLPRITERWTVPKGHFVHKKSQENFERITLRRLIQIQDGHPETVVMWLGFLRKHAYYGIGMKANIWDHEELGVGKRMDTNLENIKQVLDPRWAHFGRNKNLDTSEKVMELLRSERFRKVDDGPLGSGRKGLYGE